jgi:hypothetical protein
MKTLKEPHSLRFAEQFTQKQPRCHSERSEESLCTGCQNKERFLLAPLLGMTHLGPYSAICEAMTYKSFPQFQYFASSSERVVNNRDEHVPWDEAFAPHGV